MSENTERRASDAEVERQIRRMSRRSLLWGAAATAAGFTGWRWLITRRAEDGVLWPLRRVLETNEQLARDYFKPARLSPTFPQAMAAKTPRVNGDLGLSDDLNLATWKLRVLGLAERSHADNAGDADDAESEEMEMGGSVVTLTLKEIKALPFVEMVTELRCIEGWSEIIHWGGARLADFIARYPPKTRSGDPADVKHRPEDLPGYVSIETPDGAYYVGLEMASALHPQTLLCYQINGRPLTMEHGAPLRLVIPVKYGIKNIKRIGTIRFTNRRPADYWAERGYDWYAGH